MAWMMENDKVSSSSSNVQYSTDGSDKGSSLNRHDKHSHKR